MLATKIKPRLENLIAEAEKVNTDLVKKLREIRSWVKTTKPGSLTKKRELMFFLRELIEDVELWLAINELDASEKAEALNELTPTEQYWYTFLFPAWFQKYDSKFSTWKQELMSGRFDNPKDRKFFKSLSQEITTNTGSILIRYICDLSMATDLIVSGNLAKPLCNQLTISRISLLTEKIEKWQKTLNYWEIQRGLLLSYHPEPKEKQQSLVRKIAVCLLENSDNLPDICYLEKEC
jgi:hypothetical protein